jgi:nucleoside 2-deoxyribosyltransferase
MKIYLAGAMSGLTYEEMNNWREEADIKLRRFNIKSINPVSFYNSEIDPTTFTDRECMLFDLVAVKKSDLILVNLNHNSIGTAIELYESYKSGIPVIGFNSIENTHSWMKECCYKICDNLDNAVRYISDYYNRIL